MQPPHTGPPRPFAPPACPARCARCNGDFIPQPLPVERLPEGHGVPEGIQRTHTEFWVCSRWWVPTEGLGRVVAEVQVLARAPRRCAGVWQSCGAVGCCMARIQQRGAHAAASCSPACVRLACSSAVYWQGNQYNRAVQGVNKMLAAMSVR